jgi:hypothetical protein
MGNLRQIGQIHASDLHNKNVEINNKTCDEKLVKNNKNTAM